MHDADVWIGTAGKVPLIASQDMLLTLPKTARRDMVVSVEYAGPIPAPIEEGSQLGTLRVVSPDEVDRVYPLLAGTSVEKLGPVGRIQSAVNYLIFGPGN